MSVERRLIMNETVRLPIIDQLRGFAFVLMAIFHFCFDLVFLLGVPIPIFNHPFWLGFRMVILLLFLGMVGVCLSLNYQRGFVVKKYHQRLLKLAAIALLITLVTAIMMPQLVIFFGIIHLIFVSSFLALPFLLFGKKLEKKLGKNYLYYYVGLGVALLLIGHFVQIFPSNSIWSWLWLTSPIPQTGDYAPIVPWFGFVLIGIALGYDADKWAKKQYLPIMIDRPLRWCGRHALILYLVHQPILWAGFFAYFYLFLR